MFANSSSGKKWTKRNSASNLCGQLLTAGRTKLRGWRYFGVANFVVTIQMQCTFTNRQFLRFQSLTTHYLMYPGRAADSLYDDTFSSPFFSGSFLKFLHIFAPLASSRFKRWSVFGKSPLFFWSGHWSELQIFLKLRFHLRVLNLVSADASEPGIVLRSPYSSGGCTN